MEAKWQMFRLMNIFLSQTVLALPWAILQAFAVLMHQTVTQPKLQMTWQKKQTKKPKTTKRAAAKFY